METFFIDEVFCFLPRMARATRFIHDGTEVYAVLFKCVVALVTGRLNRPIVVSILFFLVYVDSFDVHCEELHRSSFLCVPS